MVPGRHAGDEPQIAKIAIYKEPTASITPNLVVFPAGTIRMRLRHKLATEPIPDWLRAT